MTLVLVACGDQKGSTNSSPPPEMVGVWQEAVPQSASSGKPADICDGLTVNNKSVSSFLFKVDEFGNVFDGRNMTNSNQPYRTIGTMNSEGLITPNSDGRREFLGDFADVTGVTLNPIVNTVFSLDPMKGELILMNIQLQIIANGQTQTQDWGKREYRQISEAQEKVTITKAQQCLAKAKGV
ncbi:MAG: hypothetical protein IT287_07915 [Bdellovibrionaceae bacterium]|nr:hypothetical protein [Pseudobdellovibrionaceae bacterium]